MSLSIPLADPGSHESIMTLAAEEAEMSFVRKLSYVPQAAKIFEGKADLIGQGCSLIFP